MQPKDNEQKPLPIGISDYVRAQSEYYYVDKTLLIKEFLDRKPLVYGRHHELTASERIADYEKEYYARILSGTATEVELSSALERLSKMLADYYGKAPIIIIDEYDTPIQEGYSKDFYDEIIGFMRNFFSGAFKDNKNLSYGFLTGILRIAQESIFSGLNNLTVNSVLDEEYDSFFGFTGEHLQPAFGGRVSEDTAKRIKI